jgi:hypothetical protein
MDSDHAHPIRFEEASSLQTEGKAEAKCNFCDLTEGLEWHHIIPRSMGGTDERFNLLLVCNVHHAVLHSMRSRGNISKLTKDGLARARARGVKLGGPNSKEAGKLGAASNASKADEFAAKMRPTVERLRTAGMSYQAIADEFNANGTKTVRGGAWQAMTVRNLCQRWE